MSVTLTDIQNGEPVYLARNLSVAAGGLEVALCELTYYQRWFNISAALRNNQVSDGHTTSVSDGYYNVCELNEEVFQPFACTNRSLTAVCEETSGLKQRAGQTPWVFLR
ncbi:MAG: hypothetical protein AB2541_01250, partial [Candidatus Thiodiazotropha sp.]